MKIQLPLDGKHAARVREGSQLVFKSQYLLEILLVMAQEDSFYHGQILASVPGTGGAFVTGVLKRYVDAGMIAPQAAEDGQARRHHRKRQPDDPFWSLLRGWAGFLVDNPADTVGRLTPVPQEGAA
jgi:hypothetical protein